MRRARISFWVLVLLYAASLCSELLCNNTPLYVRFEGQGYFPIFRFYPEETFLKNGHETRPDYKSLESSPQFTRNPRNMMVFPPVPYGPYEIIDATSIPVANRVSVVFTPITRMGWVNVGTDFTVVYGESAGWFFGKADDAVTGLNLEDYFVLDPGLREAVRLRFQNSDAPSASLAAKSRSDKNNVVISLSTFEKRKAPPSSVRLTLKQSMFPAPETRRLVLKNSGAADDPTGVLKDLYASDRGTILARARDRMLGPIEDIAVSIGSSQFRVSFEMEELRFPFRPVAGHFMGIDDAGRDVFARILYGLRTSMTFGIVLVLFSMFLGTLAGSVQGYYGGLVDITGQRLTEIWSALPFLYVMILMGSVYGRSFVLLLFCYGIFNWIGISYYMRAEFLRLRKFPFVEAAKCLGLSSGRIISRHILPNAIVPLVTFSPFSLVGAIGALAALDYLGFGLPPPTPSWGELLSQAQQFRWAWWLILFPSLVLFLVMLLGVLVGEGVRNAFDPKPYGRLR
jgi:microcin C transport system permease protein